jgi:hypothetical protein
LPNLTALNQLPPVEPPLPLPPPLDVPLPVVVLPELAVALVAELETPPAPPPPAAPGPYVSLNWSNTIASQLDSATNIVPRKNTPHIDRNVSFLYDMFMTHLHAFGRAWYAAIFVDDKIFFLFSVCRDKVGRWTCFPMVPSVVRGWYGSKSLAVL